MNAFDQCDALLKEGAPIASKYLGDADERVNQLTERLQNGRLQVMLFGAYNAGKSTLVNALLGTEAAQVGDVPTTDSVTAYDWSGHVLLDTPGVNAPIEHEQVSREQLERTDLVLFVLRQEDQDAEDVMRRIFELLADERPVFLLLNYSDSDPASISIVREHLNRALIRYARGCGYPLDRLARLPVVLMSIPSALKARLENKSRLLEHSGYDDFILRLDEWLREHDGVSRRLDDMRATIDRVILEPVRQAMQAESAGATEGDRLSHQISHLQRERTVLKDAAVNRLRRDLAQRRPELSALFDQGDGAEQVLARTSEIANELADAMQDWLNQEVAATLDRSIDTSLGMTELKLPARQQGSEVSLFDSARDAALVGAKRGASAENLSSALKFGRKLKVPFLKGRWTKTLDKWAGKAAPLLQVALAGFEIWRAHKDEQRANQERLDWEMQRSQWVDDCCTQIQAGLTKAVEALLCELFESVMKPLQEQQTGLRAAADENERDRQDWRELSSRLHSIRL